MQFRSLIGLIGLIGLIALGASTAACTPEQLAAIAAIKPAAAATTGPVFVDGFGALPVNQAWPDDSVHGQWRSVFHGTGTRVRAGGVLRLAPPPATAPDRTHAALVVSNPTFGDLDLRAELRTVRQLRTGSAANPWEAAWLLWGYGDNTHFYYLVLKPNGWELGKADPAYPGAQRFLATGSSPSYRIGPWYKLRVRQVGSTITVTADGTELVTFTDAERPYRSGAIGLYTEDAEVQFRRVQNG